MKFVKKLTYEKEKEYSLYIDHYFIKILADKEDIHHFFKKIADQKVLNTPPSFEDL